MYNSETEMVLLSFNNFYLLKTPVYPNPPGRVKVAQEN